ncbi:putative GTP binding protein [Aspergillus clavatus NRRL 1]|uniref:GTP binding protein n=1 Tax=Aspergillus clavatus (strain ATCC 1007 / CBS 513.65 / DSM 816 / NCTC 3887 / NRRL 1 / QM 1276 / 107) TaxID=344612 RepID=A1C909_ASPCL|nr:uncharacterized protein ACLA_053790 [Aspergillus clavatus NRRL 1]EAW13333.1 conserved hypothetical protein [Aspergillus clavatus NRRL 1]
MSSQQESGLICPSLGQVLPELEPGQSFLPAENTLPCPAEQEVALFRRLQDILAKAEGGDEGFDDAQTILCDLWKFRSRYLSQAAEALADGSRITSWRIPYGQAGILDFFLQIIASKDYDDNDVLLHSLRLVGNSCADTDENRAIVVKGNYTAAILTRLGPELVHVVIPVIYNICIDYGQIIKDDLLEDRETLLDFSYELIELLSERGIQSSPDGTILILMELLTDPGISFSRFVPLANCLVTYLNQKRFQDICVQKHMVDRVLAVLERSLSIETDPSSAGDTQALAQLQLKINQTLSEISASPMFPEAYPLDSSLTQNLKAWLASTEDQLQICACVMLGNIARSDAVCEVLVREINIHAELISILASDARGAVLHSALGFLKNLAIAGENRKYLGEAGIIPAISRLWGYESVPQVQFAATSMARQVIVSSIENISRLLDYRPADADSTTPPQTCLSLLLSLSQKSDSTPIKTEIGRTVASICRTLVPKSREQDSEANALLGRLFTLNEGVALPVGAMITQSQWPVVRSEGWFALALMASSKHGTVAAIECLRELDLYPLLEETMRASTSDSTDEADRVRLKKDCDNIVVLVQEILKHDPDALPVPQKATLEGLVSSHVSQQLKDTRLV